MSIPLNLEIMFRHSPVLALPAKKETDHDRFCRH
jgi:hypothetical protein